MFDPYDPRQFQSFVRNVRACHRKLDSYRKSRKELIQDFVGPDYGESNHSSPNPVNWLAATVDIYLMHLAGSGPQVLLPTPRRDILPFVADLEAVVNKELEDMGFDHILRRWVQDAIFCMGVVKCGLVDGEYIEIIPGHPQPSQDYFVDLVDFDDFVFDTDATTWEKIRFIGDRYKMDYDAAMMNEGLAAEAKHELRIREEEVDAEGERASGIGIASEDDGGESAWKRTTWVWDVCVPEDGIVVTFADSESARTPLKVVEWDGPTNSPYHTLWFTDVPGNLMPLAPGMVLKPLNKALNHLYEKLVNQAKRQKRLTLYRLGDKDSAERIQKAADGEMVGVQHPDNAKQVDFGGPAPENVALAIQLRDQLSALAGNIDAMGGLGPQSETAKQDALIANQVSQKSAKMTRAVVDATTDVVRDIIYRIWNDPIRTYQATRQIPGTSVQVEAIVSPGERFGNFGDLDVKIEPYSMKFRSPGERAQEIIQMMTNMVFPMMPFLQEQGIGIDIQHLFQLLSKYMSLPELQHIFQFVGPPVPGTAGQEAKQPQMSHRTYERVNRPGATQRGNNQTMQQILSGAGVQGSQAASLGRPTGA